MLKKLNVIASFALVTAGGASAALAAHHEVEDAAPHAAIINGEGKQIGTVVFEQTPNGVLISASIEGLAPGAHGFHLHETGVCDTATGFKSAGGHYAPRSHDHGIKEASGPHAGDMPNQFVSDDGALHAHVLNSAVTTAAGFNSLMDDDGTALVIHAGADDYMSQPSGAAGVRLACAVISPPKDKVAE